MKALKPSMRENKRYLHVVGENLSENIEKAILEFAGILGMSQASLLFIKKNSGSAVISVNRGAVNVVRASFAIYPKKISVKKISGTLKGLNSR